MTRFSDRHVDEFCDTLIALSRKQGKEGEQKLYAVEILVQRYKRAYARDRSGSAIPDGYPRGSGAGGGSPGLPRRTVDADAHGGEESVEFTSVELAYLEREHTSRSHRDHHHELVLQATEALSRLVKAKDDLEADLARIENLVDVNPDAASMNMEAGCSSCARYKDGSGRAYFSPATAETGGRRGLCQWCNGWVSDTAANPDAVLPPVELIERRARGQRITTQVVDEVKAATKRRAS